MHRTFGERNRIESNRIEGCFITMKARTRRFFNNFPARKMPILKIKLLIRRRVKRFMLYFGYE